MFECHACGHAEGEDDFVSAVFTIDGRRVLVERIPCAICKRCGEATYSGKTAERVRRMVRGESSPLRTESLEVFSLG